MSTTQQLTATPRNSSGTAITGKTATWSSNNTAIATVSSTGLVTAVSPGSATITATVDGVAGTSTCAVTAPASLSYSLSAFTSRLQIQRGQSNAFYVDITRSGGYTGNVVVTAPSGLSGVTITVGTGPGSLGTSVSIPNGTTQFLVNIAVAAGAALGTTAISIPTTGTNGLVANQIVQLDVTDAQSFSVSGSLSPASLTIARGGSQNTTLTIIRNGGYTGQVALSLFSGTLEGAFPFDNPGTVSFSPAVIPAGQTTSTITVSLPAGWTAPAGQQFFTIRMTPSSGDPSNVSATFTTTG